METPFFHIVSQWELLVAMTTTVVIQTAPKPETGQLVLQIFMFESVGI